VRLGATLLSNAASSFDLASAVLWDPVGEGAEHRAELVEAHRRYIRGVPLFSLRARLGLRSARGPRELLGATYSETGLRELGALSLRPFGSASCPVETLSSSALGWSSLSSKTCCGRRYLSGAGAVGPEAAMKESCCQFGPHEKLAEFSASLRLPERERRSCW